MIRITDEMLRVYLECTTEFRKYDSNDSSRHYAKLKESLREILMLHDKENSNGLISLRDDFASKAMQSLIAGSFTDIGQDEITTHLGKFESLQDLTSKIAYQYADAMLRARCMEDDSEEDE